MAKSGFLILIAFLVFSSSCCYASKTSHPSPDFNVTKIKKWVGQDGQFNLNEESLQLLVPRDDIYIQMNGMQRTIDRGLSSNIIFKKDIDQIYLVNADFVLLEEQVNPVISEALLNKLEVTNLNNPYLWDSPRVMVIHVKGEGEIFKLASAIGKILKKIKETADGNGDFPLGDVSSSDTTLDGHQLDVLLGTKGKLQDNAYQVQFSNNVKADTEANKIMAMNTWAAFTGSDHETMVNGALVVPQATLQQVLLVLRNAQIYILTINPFSAEEDETLISIHFSGIGSARVLAKALRSTLRVAQHSVTTNGLAESFAANAKKQARTIPISSSLVQNNYCSYANALRTSAIEIAQSKSNTSDTLASYRSLKPSARVFLSEWSVVKDNKLKNVELFLSQTSIAAKAKHELPTLTKPKQAATKPVQTAAKLSLSNVIVHVIPAQAETLVLRQIFKFQSSMLSQPTQTTIEPVQQSPLPSIKEIFAKLSLSNTSSTVFMLRPVFKLQSSILAQSTQTTIVIATASPRGRKQPSLFNTAFEVQKAVLPSAREMLVKLSLIKNSRTILVLRPVLKLQSPILSKSKPASIKPMQKAPFPSVGEIFAELSLSNTSSTIFVLRQVFKLQSSMLSQPTHAVIKPVQRAVLPSAKGILAKSSLIKNSRTILVLRPVFKLQQPMLSKATLATAKPMQKIFFPSAKGSLSKLSLIKNYRTAFVFSPTAAHHPSSILSQVTHVTAKPIQKVLLSARELLSKLSTIKNNRVVLARMRRNMIV